MTRRRVVSRNPLVPTGTELIIGTIAFVIVFAVLARVLMPRIQKTLAERTDAIEGGIKRAEDAQAEANQAAGAVPGAAGRGPARGRAAARGGQGAGRPDHRRDARAGPGRGRRITEAAQAQLVADRQQALAALRNEVGAISVELAGRIVGESLTDEARQHRLVDRFLEELEITGTTQPAGTSGASGAQASS